MKIGSLNVASKRYNQIPKEIQKELTNIIYFIGSSLSRIIEVSKLKANEEILRETIHQSSDGIVIMDSHFHIISNNQRIKNLLEKSSENIQEQFFWEVLCNMHPVEDRSEKRIQNYQALIEKAYNADPTKNHILIKMKVRRGNDLDSIYEISLFPIQLQTKKMFGAFIRDITKQVEIESLKNLIINNVSHEMRTPLTAMRSSVHLLMDSSVGPINEQQKNIISICLRNIDRLSSFVDNILDFQQINDCSFCLTLQKRDLRKVLLESTHFFASIAYDKKVEIQTDIPSFPIEVKIDEKHFKKALFAIIANAVKRTQNGSIKLTVDFLPMQEKLQIHVCDTGRGMQPYELQDMFTSHTLHEPSIDFTNRNLLGINLALSKKVIELHRGSLWATSGQKEGCNIHIEIPFEKSSFT